MSQDKDLQKLAAGRQGAYRKDARSENFLAELNAALHSFEQEQYEEAAIEHPIFMVIGAPRSGTTFCTQFLANAFSLGYVNNLVARFYQNPLTALRLSDQILGKGHLPSFSSHYAKTEGIHNIHEFGYFWRHWLHKGSLEAMESIAEDEARIDWQGLYQVLANMQQEWGRPSVYKNIFGSYHMPKMTELLEKVVWVYIERDELDVALSIYGARERHYGKEGLKKWWSYSPPNVLELLDLEPIPQIAAQVHYLKAYYQEELAKLDPGKVVKLNYAELTQHSHQVAEAIQKQVKASFDYDLSLNPDLPSSFAFNQYRTEQPELRAAFQKEFETLRNS